MFKKYSVNSWAWEIVEDEKGDICKVDEVINVLNTSKQIKDEIASCLDSALYSDTGNIYIINKATYDKLRQLALQ